MNFEHKKAGDFVYLRKHGRKMLVIKTTKYELITEDGRRWKKKNGRLIGDLPIYIES